MSQQMRLWYSGSAKSWNEALPFGNGRLGGMVFGAVENERIQLNEDSMWYGGPRDRNNPDAQTHLHTVRELLFSGKIQEAEKLTQMAFTGLPETQRHYTPLGDLLIQFEHEGHEEDYLRELDLDAGIVRVRYQVGGASFTREVFSSNPDQVIAIRVASDEQRKVSFSMRLSRGQWRYAERTGRLDENTILLDGCTGGRDGVDFYVALRCINDGGNVRTVGEHLVVEGADSVILLLAAETTFRYDDPKAACLNTLSMVSGYSYEDLRTRHVRNYRSLYDRVSFTLGEQDTADDAQFLPTDERLHRVRQGHEDLQLVSLYFQFARYLLISSSRPGTLPANLQGIWNEQFLPAWDSKYTININTEMNYWLAEVCNLAECHQPLFDLIERMREPGRRTAEIMYGCRGFTAHHNTDIWGDTAPQDSYLPASYWPLGAAWLCLHLWEHYAFTLDESFLQQVYPTLKEAALFLVDYLVEGPGGTLVTCPSVSPENTYILPSGESGVLCFGSTMDMQMIRALFTACVEVGNILGLDEEFADQLELIQERLPTTKIGKHGQIQEWFDDYEEAEPGHRHISHLFGLHPGNQITLTSTPELAAAARVTLERRLAHGGGHTGWSRAWIINFWARLGDGQKAYENIVALLQKSTLSNLFDDHPPFQIDGNFGAAAGIAEMLVQSHANEIHLLPALPTAWSEGSVKGLRARGGYEIDIEWKRGKLKQAFVTPNHDGTCRLRNTDKIVPFNQSTAIKFRSVEHGVIEFRVDAGRTYRIVQS